MTSHTSTPMASIPPPSTTGPASATDLRCPVCGEQATDGARFCEACGTPLDPGALVPAATARTTPAIAAGTAIGSAGTVALVCPTCGPGPAIDEDGYCTECGHVTARPRDHIEAADRVGTRYAAVVSDRGVQHHRNEDAGWIAIGGPDRVDVVVCDGVSNSTDPDVASETAVAAAGAILATGSAAADPVAAGPDAAGAVSAGPVVDGSPASVVRRAVAAAADAVCALVDEEHAQRKQTPPACTIVAGTWQDGTFTYGWLGDSRAYFVPADGPAVQLTEDDSWAAAALVAGLDPQHVSTHPQAHAITAWLGADAEPAEPRIVSHRPDRPGLILVCSDGLWNYLPDPAEFADTVRHYAAETAAADTATAQPPAAENPMLTLARALVGYAIGRGGSDNVTVAVFPITPSTVP